MNDIATPREQIVAKVYSAVLSDVLETVENRASDASFHTTSTIRLCSSAASAQASTPIPSMLIQKRILMP